MLRKLTMKASDMPSSGDLINGPNGKDTLAVLDSLGYGSFGLVFKAQDVTTGTYYAVKIPHLGLQDLKQRAAFLNEVQAAQRIQHPNIVQVVHVEADGVQFPYIVMEFLGDGTLQAQLDNYEKQNEQIGIQLLQKWSNDLIAGIAAINAKMLHRDIKPDNILLDGNTLKIADFGLSKIVDAMTRSPSRTFKGGQHMWYMAPEGWKYETNGIQLDMYAVGIVLFQMATLQYPYDLPQSLSQTSFQDMHLFQSPKSLRQIRPDLPIGYHQIVSRLIEKRPEDRFESWNEVQKTLDNTWKTTISDTVPDNHRLVSLLETVSYQHEVYTERQLEKARREEEKRQQEELDRFQIDKLIQKLNGIVDDFNEATALGQITVHHATGLGRISYILPYRHEHIQVQFFDITPTIHLTRRKWNIRSAAIVSISDGRGFNLLLCRGEEDLYGKWVVCDVTVSPLVGMNRRRPQPFGFDNNTQVQQELEKSDIAMHIYQLDFSENVQGKFLELIETAMKL